jgi:hypothetical protein
MNFLRFDPSTGKILEIGYMKELFIQQEIDEGKPTMFFEGYITREDWCVNILTKEVEPVTPVSLTTTETPDNNNGATSS